MKQNTVVTLAAMKVRGEKISQLTCYDYTTACLMDQAGVNMVLVGDSLGMTMQGYADTLPVTLEEMILYGRSVARGCRQAFVVVDMPFMSYQVSPQQALANAGRIMQETGADAVKLEGGRGIQEQIRAITGAGIPVCAHIGMTPQSYHAFGGFKVQGKERTGLPPCWPTRWPSRLREPLPWCWSACPPSWPPWLPGSWTSSPSASAPEWAATARSWSGKTCWA